MKVALDDKRRLEIIINVERLITDAHILLEHGSAGSALASAILAFEEAGKGHRLELDIEKSKRTSSWHHFRQVVSGLVLFASLGQKYGLTDWQIDDELQKQIEDHWSDKKRLEDAIKEPIPEEFRSKLSSAFIPALDSLSDDQLTVLQFEQRWVKKVVFTAFSGQAEKERQSGMYVDIIDDDIVSTPTDISKQRAYYWITVAERILQLLRDGEYRKPYGEMAAVLEALPKPLPQGQALINLMENLQKDLPE